MNLSEEAILKLQDLKFFAENFFKIRTKKGEIIPFKFKRAQLFAHQRLEAQLQQTGRVRAVALKGRQMGFSTYIQARDFHKILLNTGFKAFILTHETSATENLFGMTKRFYDDLPPGLVQPAIKDTQEQLIFGPPLNSSYAVGTARNRGAGRSQTIQLLHGSEVGFWEHAREHATGLLQAIGNLPGTEVVLESTANGIGNYFYDMWRQGCSGESDWQAIFLPWYWDDDYKDYAPGFQLSAEELELMNLYGADGLTKEHLAWRRKKIADFGYDWDAGVAEFKQEFPFNANEAFRNPVEDVFITASHVQRARKSNVLSESSLVIGVDPAIGERDRCVIVRRKGRLVYNVEILTNHNTMELAGRLKHIIEKEVPLKVFIDPIGIGAGTVDRLQEMGFSSVVGVDVRRTANDKVRFGNLRAELWWEMRDWLYQADLPVQIPDSDELEIDLCSLGYKYRSNGQLLIESKEDAKARGLRSPDCFVGATLISTPQGKVPIVDLKVGDFVDTPMGPQKIIQVWVSKTDTLTTVNFSNKIQLTGKGAHQVFTWDKGWVTMDALMLTNVVEHQSWSTKLKWKFLSMLCTRISDTGFKHQVNIITAAEKLTRKGFYTGAYGSNILEKSRQIMLFITRTMTGRTTALKISNALIKEPMLSSICRSDFQIQNIEKQMPSILKRRLLKQQNGINLQRQNLLSQRHLKKDGREELLEKRTASLVERNLSQYAVEGKALDFAQINVLSMVATKSKKLFLRNVVGAIKNFLLISIGMSNVVPVSVQAEKGDLSSVYNLTLEKENVYYANGILVANCADAMMLTFAEGQMVGRTSFTPNFIPAHHQKMFM